MTARRRMLFFSSPAYTGPDARVLGRHLVDVAGVERPRICYVPTATGDNPDRIAGFYETLQPFGLRPVHVSLIRGQLPFAHDLVMESDIIYVGGGNTAAMMAQWRLFGFDSIMQEAWEAGKLMSGHSAGAICWFEAYLSDSFGGTHRFTDGLGWLTGSCCTHYDAEPHRQPAYREAVSEGFPAGYAMEDGSGIYVEDTNVVEIVTARQGKTVRRIDRGPDGNAIETALDARLLEATI